jgi:signal peptidase I
LEQVLPGMANQSDDNRIGGWVQAVTIGRNPKFTLVRIVVLVAVCLVVFNYVIVPIRVQGISMLPTYKENSVNFVNCLAYKFHPPQRGDVISIKLAGKHMMYLKRVVGLPGDEVSFHNGQLHINGHPVDEPYLRFPCQWEHGPEVVGPDEYYVVGDNRSMDIFDHEHGRAARSRIVGKVLL